MGYSVQNITEQNTWTPTFTGFSADPTTLQCRYVLVGKLCHVQINMTGGTSNATTFTLTLPFVAKTGNLSIIPALGTDNGTNQNSWVRTRSNSNILDVFKTVTTTTWTNPGVKGVYFSLSYEIN